MTLDQYLAVSSILHKRFGITAQEAGFGPDDYQLQDETPEEWVDWYGNKYNLFEADPWR